MHINIGSLQEPQDIVDLLLECHERIRSFAGVARRIAETTSASADEICDAAARVSRYFSEALPLHVADEEQSIIPRLAGKNADVDAALAQMHGEHQEHEQKLKVVLETCNTLKTSPQMLDDLRDRLLDAATALETEFASHLKQEEDIVFPAIRSMLSSEQRAAMLAELRGRRRP